jgi:uncharacterized small protein (DUF1192 family)
MEECLGQGTERFVAGFIDSLLRRVNDHAMDMDELLPKAPGDPLVLLMKQDIDRLSVEELNARITALEAEIARAKAKIEFAANHRLSAESLFKR